MNRKKILTIFIAALVCIILASVSWIYGFTVVSTDELAMGGKTSGWEHEVEFDEAVYVDEIWESKIIPTILEEAHELSTIINKMVPDRDGFMEKEDLIQIAEEYGLITVGEAHAYMVKGTGEVTSVCTETSTGIIELSLDGYSGPIKVNLYVGPRMPFDESSVRDSVGFIKFGDFREQTEYGKVGTEINKRCIERVGLSENADSLLGKKINFYGAFTIRTFNLVEIDMKEILIVPIQIEVVEG
jgi:predicted lipoprotein